MVRRVKMPKVQLTFKEKKECIKWQIALIEETETDVSHYLCVDFWKWLDLKGKTAYINTGYNLTLFPELLNAIKLIIKENNGTFVLDHTRLELEVSPIHYGIIIDCNIFRIKFLKNLKIKK